MSGSGEPREETSRINAVKRQWLLRQQAAQKPHFKVVDGEFVQFTISPPADDLATTVADAVAAEIVEAEIGQMVEGHGIFFGTWEPKDRKGKSLGKIFNVFAAPEDLTDDSGNGETYKYVDAVERLAALKNWHGHDGMHYATDKKLYKALRDGSYNGGWIIPTSDLLIGKDVDGKTTQPDNLYARQNTGALKGTFCMETNSDSGWYWSSTKCRGNLDFVQNACLSDGYMGRSLKDNSRQSCRPVRLEPRS